MSIDSCQQTGNNYCRVMLYTFEPAAKTVVMACYDRWEGRRLSLPSWEDYPAKS